MNENPIKEETDVDTGIEDSCNYLPVLELKYSLRM